MFHSVREQLSELLASATDTFIVFLDISNLLVVKKKYSTIRN